MQRKRKPPLELKCIQVEEMAFLLAEFESYFISLLFQRLLFAVFFYRLFFGCVEHVLVVPYHATSENTIVLTPRKRI